MILLKSFKKLFFLLFCLLFASFYGVVLASEVNVSATIPDTTYPSVPILIEPSDGSLLGDNTPSFKWYEATDNMGLSHYAFYLNGNIYYNNLPLTNLETSLFTLDYDSLNGIYTLTPKNSLSDNSYTWKIVAVDYADLASSSDTWDFRIDTLAPNFTLTKIGDTSVNISAGSVVSSTPVIIFKDDATANEPTLIASGEPNSSVKLTVIVPGDTDKIYTTNIDGNGYYEIKLGILPRDTDIRLDFIITDQIGHISVLEKVYFRIQLQYWPTTSPTSTPTTSPTTAPSLTPSPSVSLSIKPSGSLTPSPTLTPTLSLAPSGIIPIIPPKEIIHEAGDELIELLPEPTANAVRDFLNSALWKKLSLFLALLLLLVFYLFAFLLLLSKFVGDFSLTLLKKIFILLFPTLYQAKKNLVFEYRDTLASPLVKVELLDQDEQVIDLAISNLQGNFNDLNYPLDKDWRLRVKDSNFYYPIGDEKPKQLEFWHFYQGQVFNADNYHGQSVVIPTLRAAGQDNLPILERFRIYMLYLLDYPNWFAGALVLFCLLFVFRYFSIYNLIALLFCLLMFAFRLKTASSGEKQLILNTELSGASQFSDNLVLSFFDKITNSSRSLVMPFEFSRSKPLRHDFSKPVLTVFARKIALKKDNLVVGSEQISLFQKKEEITLQVERI